MDQRILSVLRPHRPGLVDDRVVIDVAPGCQRARRIIELCQSDPDGQLAARGKLIVYGQTVPRGHGIEDRRNANTVQPLRDALGDLRDRLEVRIQHAVGVNQVARVLVHGAVRLADTVNAYERFVGGKFPSERRFRQRDGLALGIFCL